MPGYDAPSRCSGGTPVAFHWYGYPQAVSGKNLDAATEAFFTAITPEGRLWNPYARSMARAEFRDRVQAAARGELIPVDEVKPVDVKHAPPLYEIRWQGIHVTDRVDGQSIHGTILVRMYHSEPTRMPGYFIGHHVHEKLVDIDDVNSEQNVNILIAKRFYESGESTNWGIVPHPGSV